MMNYINTSVAFIVVLFSQFPLFAQKLPISGNTQNYYYLEEIFAKMHDPLAATQTFYEALENLNRPSKENEERLARLGADIVDIMSTAEFKQWKKLKTAENKIAFLKRFWHGRDLTPATVANERLVEHYQRLLYARENYAWFDIKEYDDRGQIYVQYGPPDDKIEDGMNSGTVSLSSWVYHRLGRSVSFDFVNAGYGRYQLTTRLSEAIRVVYPHTYVSALEELLRHRIFLHPNYLHLYVNLDDIFELNRQDPGAVIKGFNQIRARIDRYVNEYSIGASNDQARLPKASTETLKDSDDLPYTINLARFQGTEHKLDLVAAYGLRKADLKGKADTLRIQVFSAIRDTTLQILASREMTHYWDVRLSQTPEEFVSLITYSLPTGKYYLALDISNTLGRQRGLRDFSAMLDGYPNGILHLSSAIFAMAVSPGSDSLTNSYTLNRYNLSIAPYPFTSIKRHTPIFVYFEIYDLQRDVSGETFYEVEYEVHEPAKKGFASLLASLNPFGKSGGSISVSDTRRGKAAVEPTYLQLDFSQLRSGKYDLIVRVTDKVAHITKESKLEFELE